jgi:hypothetical protein
MTVQRTTRAIRRRALICAAPIAGLLTLTGCNLAHQGLSASSTCADYLKASASDQVNVVTKLYHDAHPQEPAAGPGAANAVFNVSYECQQQPAVSVGSLGDFAN